MLLEQKDRKLSFFWMGILAAIALPVLLQLPHISLATVVFSVLLACPFIILGCVGLLVRRPSTVSAMIALSFFMIFPWSCCLFLMAWFKPGFLGAAIFGALMGAFALLAALFVGWISALKHDGNGRRLSRVLFSLLLVTFVGAILTAWSFRKNIENHEACFRRLEQESADALGRPLTHSSLMRNQGFIPVCEGALEPYELSGHLISRWLSPPPVFTPVSLQNTPFTEYDAGGSRTESINGIPSRIYRGFRTPDGLQVVLMEHDMSADGSSVTFVGEGDEERVHGAVARLTVMQAESGKTVSLLSWQEGRRLYNLSVNTNITQAEIKQWLLALAASLPPSIPACPNELASDIPHPPPSETAPYDGQPKTLTDEEMQARLARAKRPRVC